MDWGSLQKRKVRQILNWFALHVVAPESAETTFFSYQPLIVTTEQKEGQHLCPSQFDVNLSVFGWSGPIFRGEVPLQSVIRNERIIHDQLASLGRGGMA